MTFKYCSVILAGGRSSRMGTNKVTLAVEGVPLAARAVAAVPESTRTVLVGPPGPIEQALGTQLHNDPRLVQTQEDPPFGGPVAGIVAGLSTLDSVDSCDTPVVALLACDIPGAPRAVKALLQSAEAGRLQEAGANDLDGVCALAADGHIQWLLGLYRLEYLRKRALLFEGRNASVRSLLEGANLLGIPMPETHLQDVDSPADLAKYFSDMRAGRGSIGSEADY